MTYRHYFLGLLATSLYHGLTAQGSIGLHMAKNFQAILGDPVTLPATYSSDYAVVAVTWYKVQGNDKSKRTMIFNYAPMAGLREAYGTYVGRADIVDGAGLRINPTRLQDEGTYVLVVMVAGVPSEEGFVKLSLLVPPVVQVGPTSPFVVTSGKTVTLTCAVRKAKPNVTSLHWKKDDFPIETYGFDTKYSGGNVRTPSLNIHHVTRTDSGRYSCVVDHVIQSASDEMQVDVQYPASIISMSDTSAATVFDHVTLQCVADGNPPPNITWTRDGIPLAARSHVLSRDVRASSVILRDVQVNDTGTYLCAAGNFVGEGDVKKLHLKVQAPGVSMSSTTIAIIVGSTAGGLWLLICIAICVYGVRRRKRAKEKKKFAFYYNMGRRDPPVGKSPKRTKGSEPPPYVVLPAKPVGSKSTYAGINTMRKTAALKGSRRFAKALYSYVPHEENELRLEVDDVIEVLEGEDGGWCLGYLRGRIGLFPSNYVKFIQDRRVVAARQIAEAEEIQMKRSV
ncbi:protein amalgam-like [Branchiostoma floridae x Branchiostoma japonicum]